MREFYMLPHTRDADHTICDHAILIFGILMIYSRKMPVIVERECQTQDHDSAIWTEKPQSTARNELKEKLTAL